MEEAMTEEAKKVVEAFEHYCSNAVDEKGIYPLPMVAIKNDGSMEMSAMAVSAPEAIEEFMRKIVVKREVKAIMLGLDRTTKPGQGTEFADVLTCVLWDAQKDDFGPGEWREWFKVGVINYQNEPRIIRPIDWENEFWKNHFKEELDNLKLRRRSTGEEL
jgi:hypothetical protein